MLSCYSEPFLSLSVVRADSQVRVGGLRSLCWKPLMKKGEICVQDKKTWAWTQKFPYILECEEEKAVLKSYSLNFCTLEVFFLVLLLFLYLGGGECYLFF